MKVKIIQLCLTLCNPMDYTVLGILQARILEWGRLCLLHDIFPTQGSNPGLPHCRQFLYQLSHQGSPRILEWVAYPFSRVSSRDSRDPGIELGSRALQEDSLPTELSGITLFYIVSIYTRCAGSVTKLCPTLVTTCTITHPGSSGHGISLARTLEEVFISFSEDLHDPRFKTTPTCIAVHLVNCKWILSSWAAREALYSFESQLIY